MFTRQLSDVVLACIVFFGVAHAHAAAYKCVNPQGGVEYIDLPKEGYTCSEVRTVPPPTPASDQADSLQSTEAANDSASTDSTEQDGASSEADVRQANCDTARSNLVVLQGEQDVVVTDKEGNKTLLNSEQRQAELSKAQKDVNYWCSAE